MYPKTRKNTGALKGWFTWDFYHPFCHKKFGLKKRGHFGDIKKFWENLTVAKKIETVDLLVSFGFV